MKTLVTCYRMSCGLKIFALRLVTPSGNVSFAARYSPWWAGGQQYDVDRDHAAYKLREARRAGKKILKSSWIAG